MHASNHLTLLPLLNLYAYFSKRGVGGLFYGSGRAITKGGIESYGVPLSQQELQDGCLPYVNWV